MRRAEHPLHLPAGCLRRVLGGPPVPLREPPHPHAALVRAELTLVRLA